MRFVLGMEESEVNAKKRKKLGRVSDVAKELRLQSNVPGSDCECKRLKCFTQVTEDARNKILQQFNELPRYDEQNSYLAGLISLIPIQRRRPRKPENEVANFNDSSYHYRVRVLQEDEASIDVQICYKAFLSIHGITGRRVQTIQSSLKMSGFAPVDGRGKHSNRKHALSKEIVELVMKHISSFKSRSSHYSMNKTKKIYLPEDLSVIKIYNMFKEKYPVCKISYDSYRDIFNKKFNIAFGYPRSDTCSFCDEINTKLKNMHSELSKATDKERIIKKIEKLEAERKLHLKKADTFYKRKQKPRKRVGKKLKSNQSALTMPKIYPCLIFLLMMPIIVDSYPFIHLLFIFYLLTMLYFTLIQKQKVKKEARMCVL